MWELSSVESVITVDFAVVYYFTLRNEQMKNKIFRKSGGKMSIG